MGRRSDHSRDELRAMALRAAERIAERDGLRGLSARLIARKIGYTVGTLYNLFADFDDLVLHVNGRTLDALHAACTAAPLDADPERAALELARRYHAFTRSHAKRWNVLFEHTLPPGRPLPEWYAAKIEGLLGLLSAALAPLFGPGQDAARDEAARVIWAGLHGICSLTNVDKMPGSGNAEGMVHSLVSNYLRGLRAPVRRAAGEGARLRGPLPKAIVGAQ